MISNQILQSTLDGIKNISRVDLCVMDMDGILLAATFDNAEQFRDSVLSFVGSPADSQVISGYQFFKVMDENQLEYVLIASGNSDDAYLIGKMAAFQLQSLLTAYKERFDKDNFIKNLLLDNLLLVDIYNRAKKLHIDTEARRIVFILEIRHEKESSSIELIRGMFAGQNNDFITAVDEKSIIIVKELEDGDDYPQMDVLAHSILEVLPDDRRAGTLIAYSSLGIGRLIYQLPIPLCKMFIKEVFGDRSPDTFDEETLTTINKFFDNNLNVSETSRQLYIHRNTLVYRLDKLQKSTGLDLRVFDDAITFKIALMVVKYMKYMEKQEY